VRREITGTAGPLASGADPGPAGHGHQPHQGRGRAECGSRWASADAWRARRKSP